MTIDVVCPFCKQQLKIEESFIGDYIICIHCKKEFKTDLPGSEAQAVQCVPMPKSQNIPDLISLKNQKIPDIQEQPAENKNISDKEAEKNTEINDRIKKQNDINSRVKTTRKIRSFNIASLFIFLIIAFSVYLIASVAFDSYKSISSLTAVYKIIDSENNAEMKASPDEMFALRENIVNCRQNKIAIPAVEQYFALLAGVYSNPRQKNYLNTLRVEYLGDLKSVVIVPCRKCKDGIIICPRCNDSKKCPDCNGTGQREIKYINSVEYKQCDTECKYCLTPKKCYTCSGNCFIVNKKIAKGVLPKYKKQLQEAVIEQLSAYKTFGFYVEILKIKVKDFFSFNYIKKLKH